MSVMRVAHGTVWVLELGTRKVLTALDPVAAMAFELHLLASTARNALDRVCRCRIVFASFLLRECFWAFEFVASVALGPTFIS